MGHAWEEYSCLFQEQADYLGTRFLLPLRSFQLLPWKLSSMGALRKDHRDIKGDAGGGASLIASQNQFQLVHSERDFFLNCFY